MRLLGPRLVAGLVVNLVVNMVLGLLAASGCVASGAVARPAPAASGLPAVSGLPAPSASGVPRPSGAPGNLRVLDWAGFKGAVSWTFDDAQPSHIAHYAELNAVGVPMTFYVTTNNAAEPGFLETWRRAVNDGHELGNHSVHHCRADLTGCTSGGPLATLGAELDEATSYIVQQTPQTNVWTAASPFGDEGYDDAAAARFFVNRGVPTGTVAPNDDTDPFNLPVHPVVADETAAEFNQVTDEARASGQWVTFLVHTLTPTGANWYAPVAIGEVTAGMKHARSLPDVWTGTLRDVAAYWRGQKLLSETRPTVTGTSTTWTWTLPPHFPSGKVLRATVSGGTLSQSGRPLPWNGHGYYELALDAGALTLSP
jgi:peptidoglycan/xylan/chitin deacetylase (PgdA/CDA1 family)